MLLDKAFIKHLVEYELVLCPKLENGAVDIVKLVSSFGYIVTSSALPDDVIATLSISSDGKKVITANSSLPLPVQRIGIANEYELPSSEYEGAKAGTVAHTFKGPNKHYLYDAYYHACCLLMPEKELIEEISKAFVTLRQKGMEKLNQEAFDMLTDMIMDRFIVPRGPALEMLTEQLQAIIKA